MAKTKRTDYRLTVTVVGLFASLALAVVGYAYTSEAPVQQVFEVGAGGVVNVTTQNANPDPALGAVSFVAAPSTFTDVEVLNDLLVDGDFQAVNTTTLPLIEGNSTTLTFTATSTAIIGAITNTRGPQICDGVQVAVSNTRGNQSGILYDFGSATSTSSTVWTASGTTLMNTTTLEFLTGFGQFADSRTFPGSYNPIAATYSSTTPFLWAPGESVLITWAANTATASSGDFAFGTGKAQLVNCRVLGLPL